MERLSSNRAKTGARRTARALHLFSLASDVVAAFAKLLRKNRRGQGCIRLGLSGLGNTKQADRVRSSHRSVRGRKRVESFHVRQVGKTTSDKAKFRYVRCRLDASYIGVGFAERIARAPAACHTNQHGIRANHHRHFARSKPAVVDIAIGRIDTESPSAIGRVFTVRGHCDFGSG